VLWLAAETKIALDRMSPKQNILLSIFHKKRLCVVGSITEAKFFDRE